MALQVTLPAFSVPGRVGWPAWAGLAALALLAAAHIVQGLGYPPCELCLKQRDAYWIAAALGGGLTFALAARRSAALERTACLVMAFAFLAESGVAAYHAGVEWAWWPGPTSCTGGGARLNARALSAALSGGQVHAVQCDRAAFRVLGLSMAGWNALISLALALASLLAAARVRGVQSQRYGSARHV